MSDQSIIDQFESKCKIMESKIQSLMLEKSQFESSFNENINTLNSCLRETQELRNKEGILSKHNSDLTTKLEENLEILTLLETKLERNKTKLRTSEQTILNLSRERDQLQLEVDDLRVGRELLEACKKRNERLSDEINHLMRLLDDKNDTTHHFDLGQDEQWRQNVEMLKREKEEMEKKLSFDVSELQNRILELEDERDEMLSSTELEENTLLKKQVSQLKQERDQLVN
jgi:chromosome segregation ATPase